MACKQTQESLIKVSLGLMPTIFLRKQPITSQLEYDCDLGKFTRAWEKTWETWRHKHTRLYEITRLRRCATKSLIKWEYISYEVAAYGELRQPLCAIYSPLEELYSIRKYMELVQILEEQHKLRTAFGPTIMFALQKNGLFPELIQEVFKNIEIAGLWCVI